VRAEFELRPDEVAVLLEAGKVSDNCDRIAAELVKAPLVTTGSTGQPVVHPLVRALQDERQLLARLLAQIGLTDLDDGWSGLSSSARGRKAAMARWNRHQG
jgi:hypothetical protein